MSKICPVTGKHCSEKRVYHITDIVDGKINLIDLCPICFQNFIQDYEKVPVKYLGKDIPSTNLVPKEVDPNIVKIDSETISAMLKTITDDAIDKFIQQAKSSRACPNCHWTETDIVKKGRLGCPQCYNYFGKDLEQILYYAHGKPGITEELRHVGKVPKKFAEKKALENTKSQLIKLQYKLMKAIETEDYETAAKIRDEISAITER